MKHIYTILTIPHKSLRRMLLVMVGLLWFSLCGYANQDWVKIKATAASTRVYFYCNVSSGRPDLKYSKNGGSTWNTVQWSNYVSLPNIGDSLLLRGNNPTGFNTDTRYAYIQVTQGGAEVSGDIMTLVDISANTITTIPNEYCFNRLFLNSKYLISAAGLRLSATNTTRCCYFDMFAGCISLTTGPDMSAMTEIVQEACSLMFTGCSKLTAMPAMPNVTQVGAYGCYKMFEKCYRLVNTSPLVAPIIGEHSYEYMFLNCTTMVKAPTIKATEIAYTYGSDTFDCLSCLAGMFYNCKKLNYIEVYFNSWGVGCTVDWVKSVQTTAGTFKSPCNLPDRRGDQYIPNNWTRECYINYIFDVRTNHGYWIGQISDANLVFSDTVTVVPAAGKSLSHFVEWNTSPDGTGRTWDPTNKPDTAATFYAIYEEDNPKEKCIDYTNFTDPSVRIDTARWETHTMGYYYRWYTITPFVTPTKSLDKGTSYAMSRYTVHSNPNELDPRTGNRLHTVLPDGRPSVRLGNWDKHCAERITYTYTVSPDKDILTLFYAAVLEDPKHVPENQPRFTLSILDEDSVAVSEECCSFNFVPGTSIYADTTWHIQGEVYWKEWTTMGVNLKDYVGQTIKICLTTFDCAQGGHYGYAYFGLDCQESEMHTSTCGDADSIVFEAPMGFNYRWWEQGVDTVGHPEAIISTSQQLVYRGTADTVLCDVINPKNADCYYTIRGITAKRYPLALFSIDSQTTVGDQEVVTVINTSAVSHDQSTPAIPYEPVDTCNWVVKNKATGQVVATYMNEWEPEFTLDKGETYLITLTAIMKGGCEDEMTLEVKTESGECEDVDAQLEADGTICG